MEVFTLKWLQSSCLFTICRSAENGSQTVIYCATEPSVAELSGMYFSDCSVHLTSENGSNLQDAERLWEMSERMVRLTSWFLNFLFLFFFWMISTKQSIHTMCTSYLGSISCFLHRHLTASVKSQCENFMIFLSLRLYVKSILVTLQVQNLPL